MFFFGAYSFNVAFIVDVFVNGSDLLVTCVLLEPDAFRKVNTRNISSFGRADVAWQLDSQKP